MEVINELEEMRGSGRNKKGLNALSIVVKEMRIKRKLESMIPVQTQLVNFIFLPDVVTLLIGFSSPLAHPLLDHPPSHHPQSLQYPRSAGLHH